MATKAQVEKSIFEREGFRVDFQLFETKRQPLPPYEFSVMAPQHWKISDWKNARLAAYRLLVKGVTIYRGDATPILRDLQLGNLRDSYYEAAYGPIKAPADVNAQNVTDLRARRRQLKRSPANAGDLGH